MCVAPATNRNLQEEVDKGHFRRDYFTDFNVLKIDAVPPRERPSDLKLEPVPYFTRLLSSELCVPVPNWAHEDILATNE